MNSDPTQRVIRHGLPDRLYHWTMAISVLTLLATSFLPIIGYKFPWVTAHWVAGTVLGLLLIYHIIRALIWQDRGAMGLNKRDIAEAGQALRRAKETPAKPGKYPLVQKLYHYAIALFILVTAVSGFLMMAKIDTPFWRRNPYFLSDYSWGLVYVAHGLAAMFVLSLVMIHIYFALRPEKLWITRSMILGWITADEYKAHHDPEWWQAEKKQ